MNATNPTPTGRKTGPADQQIPATVDPSELLDAGEAAKLLRQRPQTLAAWRCEKRGPEYLKVGKSVFYRRSAISAWLAGQIVTPGSSAA